jgi:hypothetical protein
MIEAESTHPVATETKPNLGKRSAIWYFLGSLATIYLIIQGNTPGSTASHILGGFFIALLLPLPHALITLAFKSMRSWRSIFKIYRGWYKALVIFCLIGYFAQLFNTYVEQHSRIH